MDEVGPDQDLVERISARLKSASNHDRRYERPMTWDEADALLSALTAAQARIAELEKDRLILLGRIDGFAATLRQAERERDEARSELGEYKQAHDFWEERAKAAERERDEARKSHAQLEQWYSERTKDLLGSEARLSAAEKERDEALETLKMVREIGLADEDGAATVESVIERVLRTVLGGDQMGATDRIRQEAMVVTHPRYKQTLRDALDEIIRLRRALDEVQETIVLAIGFLSRDHGTIRAEATTPPIIEDLMKADALIRLILSARGDQA
jgi:chromosome segregation ATPase